MLDQPARPLTPEPEVGSFSFTDNVVIDSSMARETLSTVV
jgi:hypothetical protein